MAILNQVFYYLTYLTLETYVLILNGMDSVITICDDKLMIFLHLACKLLSNMQKRQIAVMPPEFF